MRSSLSKALVVLLAASGFAHAASPLTPPHETAPKPSIEDILAEDAPPPAEEEIAKPAIVVAQVEKPSIEGFGILQEGTGSGFSSSIWKGSVRTQATGLLQQVRMGVANETLRSLVTRLLLTQAAPPAGAGDEWLLARLNALIGFGQDDKALEMITSLPASMTTDALHQLHTQLLFLRGDMPLACQVAEKFASETHAADSSGFWQKSHILCQANAGKHSEAMLGIDLMHEQNKQEDPFFQEAIRKIGDKTATIKSWPKKWSLLDVTLVRLAGDVDKLKDRFDNLPPVALKYLAQDATLDIKLRERATARAQQLGITTAKDSKLPEQPFAKPLASDVSTLVRALESGKAANSADNAVISRLALDDAGIQDSRRVQRLLTVMEPFGYKVSPDVWQKLFVRKNRFDGEVPPAVWVAYLGEAAQANRKGEVIVLAALVAGGSDMDKQSELAVVPIINALRAVGLEKEARSVAYSAVKNYK